MNIDEWIENELLKEMENISNFENFSKISKIKTPIPKLNN